ncbi:MAG: hypothetical protein ACFCU6_13785 [Balneolaceae bacterium]
MKKFILILALYIVQSGFSNSVFAQDENNHSDVMTQEKLETIIWQETSQPEGRGGVVQFIYDDIAMAVLSDTNFDRMRIIAPIINQGDMTQRQLFSIIEANFQSTLDARYATNEGVLYSAYIHPLSSLSRQEVLSALRQVAALVHNFGTTYSSDELMYLQQDGQQD